MVTIAWWGLLPLAKFFKFRPAGIEPFDLGPLGIQFSSDVGTLPPVKGMKIRVEEQSFGFGDGRFGGGDGRFHGVELALFGPLEFARARRGVVAGIVAGSSGSSTGRFVFGGLGDLGGPVRPGASRRVFRRSS